MNGRYDTQHNDIQHNDIQRNVTQHYDIQHNDTQQKGLIWSTQHKWHSAYSVLSAIMLNVVMLSAVKPSVVAPHKLPNFDFQCQSKFVLMELLWVKNIGQRR
jgi:hypothetical protein